MVFPNPGTLCSGIRIRKSSPRGDSIPRESRMKPLAFFLRKNAVGLSQYLAILLSPRGVSPRRDENAFGIFRGIADETFRDCACGESLSVSPRRDENAFGIFRGVERWNV